MTQSALQHYQVESNPYMLHLNSHLNSQKLLPIRLQLAVSKVDKFPIFLLTTMLNFNFSSNVLKFVLKFNFKFQDIRKITLVWTVAPSCYKKFG